VAVPIRIEILRADRDLSEATLVTKDFEAAADGKRRRFVLNGKEVDAIVALPDKQENLFITLCLQNNGRLSPGKRARHFSRLTDREVAALEKVVLAHMSSLRCAVAKERADESGKRFRRTGPRRNSS
jgi:hypothetical protein